MYINSRFVLSENSMDCGKGGECFATRGGPYGFCLMFMSLIAGMERHEGLKRYTKTLIKSMFGVALFFSAITFVQFHKNKDFEFH